MDQTPKPEHPTDLLKELSNIYRHIAKLNQAIIDVRHRISLLEFEDALEEELPSEEEDQPPLPRKGHPTQVLLGTSKAARKAYNQKKNT